MTYPSTIDNFSVKLNKKPDGSSHVVEEQITVTSGVFEGELAHDNIISTSIKVFTGPKLTGKEVKNVIISIPSETPWRRVVKIFTDAPTVYVSYETPGDTVEADDINQVQESIKNTQAELDRYKSDGIIDGGLFERGK